MDEADLITRLYQDIDHFERWNRTLEEIEGLPESRRLSIAPHVVRARYLQLRLESARLSLGEWRSVLDHLSSPVILVDRQVHAYHSNLAGQKALETGEYIVSRQGRVDFTVGVPQRASLVSMTASVVRSDNPRGLAARVVSTTGRVGVLTVRALRDLGAGPLPGRAEAALFLSVSQPPFDSEVLQTVFDLTPAEARLAEQLVYGEELSSLAEQWNLSRETLKSQLDRLFQKTGTRRQTQLVAVLLSSLSTGLW